MYPLVLCDHWGLIYRKSWVWTENPKWAERTVTLWSRNFLDCEALVCMKVEWFIRIWICVTAISDFWKFRSRKLRWFFLTTCNGGVWWQKARVLGLCTERPGFSVVEVLFIYILYSRRKILAVLHTSSAPCRRGHLVGIEQIWRRAPRITPWQDARYR